MLKILDVFVTVLSSVTYSLLHFSVEITKVEN